MIQWMQIQLEQLQYFAIHDDNTALEAYQISPYELSTIHQYGNALVTVTTDALKYLGVPNPDKYCSRNSESNNNNASFCTMLNHYNDS